MPIHEGHFYPHRIYDKYDIPTIVYGQGNGPRLRQTIFHYGNGSTLTLE